MQRVSSEANDRQERRRRLILSTVSTVGLLFSFAALFLAYARLGSSVGAPLWGLLGSAAGIAAGFVALPRARLAYGLFVLAGALHLLDLTAGYVHALLFLGCSMILGGVAAVNDPVDLKLLNDG